MRLIFSFIDNFSYTILSIAARTVPSNSHLKLNAEIMIFIINLKLVKETDEMLLSKISDFNKNFTGGLQDFKFVVDPSEEHDLS